MWPCAGTRGPEALTTPALQPWNHGPEGRSARPAGGWGHTHPAALLRCEPKFVYDVARVCCAGLAARVPAHDRRGLTQALPPVRRLSERGEPRTARPRG